MIIWSLDQYFLFLYAHTRTRFMYCHRWIIYKQRAFSSSIKVVYVVLTFCACCWYIAIVAHLQDSLFLVTSFLSLFLKLYLLIQLPFSWFTEGKWLDLFLLQNYVKRQTRFVSRQPAKVIISTIESVAVSMKLKVHTRNYKVYLYSYSGISNLTIMFSLSSLIYNWVAIPVARQCSSNLLENITLFMFNGG